MPKKDHLRLIPVRKGPEFKVIEGGVVSGGEKEADGAVESLMRRLDLADNSLPKQAGPALAEYIKENGGKCIFDIHQEKLKITNFGRITIAVKSTIKKIITKFNI
jgi:hypothetical protein